MEGGAGRSGQPVLIASNEDDVQAAHYDTAKGDVFDADVVVVMQTRTTSTRWFSLAGWGILTSFAWAPTPSSSL